MSSASSCRPQPFSIASDFIILIASVLSVVFLLRVREDEGKSKKYSGFGREAGERR